jgi:secreted trypsin-like serine protease
MKRTRSAGLVLALAAILTALAAMAPAPAQARTQDSTRVARPADDGRVVGGKQAAAGAWPSQVAILRSSSSNNYNGQFCGGTVIAPTWILSAAHCFTATANDEPAEIDVLVGTQSLLGGGTRIRAAEIRIVPGYQNANTHDRDLALVRLAAPTTTPVQSLIGQNVVVPDGTSVTTTGWGNTARPGLATNYPVELQEATFPTVADSTCRSAGYNATLTASMLCAGTYPNGKDSCQGDSGGPLVMTEGGRWVQVGVVSWGGACGEYPGIYTKLSQFKDWITAQIGSAFGPHSTASAFVTASYQDLYNRVPTTSERNAAVSALATQTPAAWLSAQILGTTYQARTAAVTRLYRAFFLRDPDTSGLTYWWKKINGGTGLSSIASVFSQSSEFNNRYGSLNNGQYVDLVYQNVLGRAPDAGGRAYWKGQLDKGTRTRGGVMIGFSESNEYKRTTKTRVDAIITSFAMLRRVPTAAELTESMARPNATQVGLLFDSAAYQQRF